MFVEKKGIKNNTENIKNTTESKQFSRDYWVSSTHSTCKFQA